MRSPPTLTALVLVGALVPATFATTGGGISHQSAIVNFEHPTWVVNAMLVGTYVIVHDDGRMVRGEPCTALYRVLTGTAPLAEVVSFHCIPRERNVAPNFTTTVERNPTLGTDTLIEYQFAGDSEAHGVPILARGSDRRRTPVPTVCFR